MNKKQQTNSNHQDKEQEQKMEIQPAGAVGLVDTILLIMVQKPITDDEDSHTILDEICNQLIMKALKGNVSACKLLFERISGQPISQVFGEYRVSDEREIMPEFGLS